MDIRYFLEKRLEFVQQLYLHSIASFVERKRKIEAGEEPFVRLYSEDPEPPFLSEWLDADESLKVLGRSCISMLSASFHLYFKTWECQLGIPVDNSLIPIFKKHGWFRGYKEYFLCSFGLQFEDSQCNLSLLEELVLARNRMQHPEEISSHTSHYSDEDLRKIHRPFFVDDRERELFSEAEVVEQIWLLPPTIHITPDKFAAALAEIRRFTEWLEKSH